MTTEEFIRDKARINWSRRMVADALGIDYQKFLGMVRDCMPDVKWCARHESADRVRSCEGRRGHCSEGLRYAATRAREERYRQAVKHHIGDFVGTTREAFDFWQDHISVCYSQVRRRLKAGVNTLDAFFKPNETHLGWGQNRELFKRECDRIFRGVSRAVRESKYRAAMQA